MDKVKIIFEFDKNLQEIIVSLSELGGHFACWYNETFEDDVYINEYLYGENWEDEKMFSPEFINLHYEIPFHYKDNDYGLTLTNSDPREIDIWQNGHFIQTSTFKIIPCETFYLS